MTAEADFKARWPEFAAVPDASVTAALAVGSALVDARYFDTSDTSEATLLTEVRGLYAAHHLQTSPILASQPRALSALGQQERLASSNSDDSPYKSAADTIMRTRAGGAWVVGQGVNSSGSNGDFWL